jgi:PEP-CTERM motif
MKNLCLAALCLFAAADSSRAALVSGSMLFDNDSWKINFQSNNPAMRLTSVTVNLVSPLFLDPTFNHLTGALATGFSSINPSTAGGRDGATTFTLNFSDFGSGEAFGFDMGVDRCAGQQFAGSTATFHFGAAGGPSYSTLATFVDQTFRHREDCNTALASFSGNTNNSFDVAADTPEPGTWAMVGTALAGLGMYRRKRQS